MQLSTREWGAGDRTALLVHGIMSDSRTWRRVAPALAERGYRVIAVDLRGHGTSPRGEYSPQLFADDLVDTLPEQADLVIGHSLGGLALSLAVERLRPARAVYSDPAWSSADPGRHIGPEVFASFKRATRAQTAAFNPRWDSEDVDIEMATLAAWDAASVHFLGGRPLTGFVPDRPAVPSLVQLADPSSLVGTADADRLRASGFEVRTVVGAGHTIHRDDFDGFMKSLDGWI
ncbi:alpha/beta fold hydrolase [Streptomyces europaeiscabiei]|uniref:alpha/beta fold hydrolase n=1 Tax=Streptomyces europaeiscabiei TaxID=146819 RepID=UPI0006285164|nr:alpha/beta hydrolase [Streptomyces europaeiscabiei]MDX2523499.1 alpha/beta hydrolase [Streptomyces europaeiscabiei]MDX3665030.1 alpha/beta hydrolase [Streptomyces europaeiscabiei]MDX3707751.1 alpha/beta hydrolase [Streptomyces europaeiscabiei]